MRYAKAITAGAATFLSSLILIVGPAGDGNPNAIQWVVIGVSTLASATATYAIPNKGE